MADIRQGSQPIILVAAPRRVPRRWPWIALACLALGIAAWCAWLEHTPRIAVPPLALPAPNAFDYYRTAAGMVSATPTCTPLGLSRYLNRRDDEAPLPRAADVAAYLRHNAPALSMLRRGFAYPFQVPGHEEIGYFSHAGYRELLELVRAKGRALTGERQWAQAAMCDLDGLRLCNDLAHGRGTLDSLWALGMKETLRRDLWRLVPRLTAMEARIACRRSEMLHQKRATAADVVKAEERASLLLLRALLKKRDWRNTQNVLASLQGASPSPLRWLITGKSAVLAQMRREFATLRARAGQPYGVVRRQPAPVSAVTRGMDQARAVIEQAALQDGFLAVAFALQQYRKEHRKYPATLDALRPAYLHGLPVDPYSPEEEPVRYYTTGAGYTLYSIGPDARDDDGAPVRGPLTDDSTGDVVAGIPAR
jgi:hypothetical protein